MNDCTRQKIIDSGVDLFLEHGYHGTGLSDILSKAGVPKGSFYHYFKNKEDFLLETIEAYALCFGEKVTPFAKDTSRPALVRFRDMIETIIEEKEQGNCKGGCLIGNMAQEMADTSEKARHKVQECLDSWSDILAKLFTQAIKEGTINERHDPKELANLFVDGQQGALLRMKVEQSTKPMRRFLEGFIRILEQ